WNQVLDIAKKIGEEAKKWAQRAAEFGRDVASFTGTPIEGEVAGIEGRRDSLLQQGRELGTLTPEQEQSINEAAQKQILEARTRTERETAKEIAALEIQTTKKGLAQRLALIELERKAELERLAEIGATTEALSLANR